MAELTEDGADGFIIMLAAALGVAGEQKVQLRL